MILREGLGFNYLSQQDQQAYKGLLNAFSLTASSIDCSRLNRNLNFMKIIQTVLGDNPSIIYFNKTQIETEESFLGKIIFLKEVQSKPQTNKMLSSLETKAENIISSIKSNTSDEYSLLINLYHYLQKNIKYDKEEIQANIKGICKFPDSHNAYGALINGKAVCDGFSSAFTFLAKKLDFNCMMAIGNSAYSSTSFTSHAWNIIKVKDKYYHMDITWDARTFEEYGEYSYQYFANNDSDISNTHRWDKKTTPICSYSDLSYYRKNGIFINEQNQLLNNIISTIKKKINVFRFKLSNDITVKNLTGKHLSDLILNEAVKYKQRVQISYTWNENTRCFFGKLLN